jgi:hypothetical protein
MSVQSHLKIYDLKLAFVKQFPPFEFQISDVYIDEQDRLFLLHAREKKGGNRVSVHQFNRDLTITKLYESSPIYKFSSYEMIVFLGAEIYSPDGTLRIRS